MLFCKLFLLFISKTDFTFVKYTLNGINKDYLKTKSTVLNKHVPNLIQSDNIYGHFIYVFILSK